MPNNNVLLPVCETTSPGRQLTPGTMASYHTADITVNKQTPRNADCILVATVLLIKIYAAIISNVFRRTCLFLFITYYSRNYGGARGDACET